MTTQLPSAPYGIPYGRPGPHQPQQPYSSSAPSRGEYYPPQAPGPPYQNPYGYPPQLTERRPSYPAWVPPQQPERRGSYPNYPPPQQQTQAYPTILPRGQPISQQQLAAYGPGPPLALPIDPQQQALMPSHATSQPMHRRHGSHDSHHSHHSHKSRHSHRDDDLDDEWRGAWRSPTLRTPRQASPPAKAPLRRGPFAKASMPHLPPRAFEWHPSKYDKYRKYDDEDEDTSDSLSESGSEFDFSSGTVSGSRSRSDSWKSIRKTRSDSDTKITHEKHRDRSDSGSKYRGGVLWTGGKRGPRMSDEEVRDELFWEFMVDGPEVPGG